MHNFTLSLLLLMLSIISTSAGAAREMNWKPIIGWKHAEMQIYVETDTVRQVEKSGIKYGYGMVLFHRQYPVTVQIDGTLHVVTSLVRYYIVSCDQHIAAPITDYYFQLDRLVVITDEPLLTIDNSGKKEFAKEISKKDPLYKTLCPEYI
jgi:hypothetical protein